jgi:hypothetical protein
MMLVYAHELGDKLMAKSTKVSPDKVFVSFHCSEPDCTESARVDVNFLIFSGTPYCGQCECDMVMTYNKVEVEA